MKLYFARMVYDAMFYRYVAAGARHVLISVVNLQSGDGYMSKIKRRGLTKIREAGVKIFLDSGAFTAYELNRIGRGKENIVNLKNYTEFVKQYRQYFDLVAALDVIGNPEESYSNYVYMRMQGLDDVIPAFHRHEPLSTLDRYVGKCDYIGVGGTATFRTPDRTVKANHIRRAINHIHEKDRRVRVHLYGVMDLHLLRLFAHEIESADSTSWLQGEQYGCIMDINAKRFISYWGRVKSSYTHSSVFNVYQMVKAIREINEYKDELKVKVPHRV